MLCGVFCCCLFHFHKETLIHTETNPQSGPNVPPLLHQCRSFLALLPGDANWTPSTLSEEGHLARGHRLFLPTGTPGSVRAPSHTSSLAHPGHCQGQPCNVVVFSMYAGEEQVHYCRWTQAHALTHPCLGMSCRSFPMCILCTGESSYIPKRTGNICIHDCQRTVDKSLS